MKKVLGIFLILVVVAIATTVINPKFLGAYNLTNIARWTGMYGILTIGVAFVIITGGIDLSVGSIIGLVGTVMALLPTQYHLPVWLDLVIVAALSLSIGLMHGLLVTKLRLQPFVVTLCGLFIYRGIARYMAHDATQGFGPEFDGLKYLVKGSPLAGILPGIGPYFPMTFILMVCVGVLAAVFLNKTIWGRYLLALGRNETAARFSGIRTDRMVIAAYVISAALAGLSGVLFSLDGGSIQPSGLGNFYELYAIAGAVLGGCSLRGGEGSILGVIIGTAIVRVLYNAINVVGISTQLEFTVIGLVILIGVVADELVRRIAVARRAAREAQAAGN